MRELLFGGNAVDGEIPITAFYSGGNVHDSALALPLIKETSRRHLSNLTFIKVVTLESRLFCSNTSYRSSRKTFRSFTYYT